MASQVLNGSGSVSYTNNTGQNVRVIINYMSSSTGLIVSWAGVNATGGTGGTAIGRNLALQISRTFSSGGVTITANNASSNATTSIIALPTEIMLAPGQTFSASATTALSGTFPYQTTTSGTLSAYNITIIPEAG
jgi:hypothetical protein